MLFWISYRIACLSGHIFGNLHPITRALYRWYVALAEKQG